MIELTYERIEPDRALSRVQSCAAGATVMFLGTTRELTNGRQTRWLDYECYPSMAQQKLSELESEARRRWPLVECVVIHRLGRVDLGEASVLVAVSTPHRKSAFESAEWLMNTLKQEVPIWKQEHWADGSTEWVHPGTNLNASSSPTPPPPDDSSEINRDD